MATQKDLHNEHIRIKSKYYDEKLTDFEAEYQRNASVIDMRARKRKALRLLPNTDFPPYSNDFDDTLSEPISGNTRMMKKPRAVSKFRMGDLRVRLPATEMLPRQTLPYRQPPPKYPYWTHLKRNIMTEDQPDLEFHPYFEQANANTSDSDDGDGDKASYLDYFNDLATVITDPDSEEIHFQMMDTIFRRYKISIDVVHDYRINLRRIKEKEEREERERSAESVTSEGSHENGEDEEQEPRRKKREEFFTGSSFVNQVPSHNMISVVMRALRGYLDEDTLKLLDIYCKKARFLVSVETTGDLSQSSPRKLCVMCGQINCLTHEKDEQPNIHQEAKRPADGAFVIANRKPCGFNCFLKVQRAPVGFQVMEKLQRGKLWTNEEQYSFEQGQRMYGRYALCEIAKFMGDNMTCYEIWLHLGRPPIADLATPSPNDEDDRLEVLNDSSEGPNSRSSTPRAIDDGKQHHKRHIRTYYNEQKKAGSHHNQQPSYRPCYHPGQPCREGNPSCHCYQGKLFCTKYCGCDEKCKWRFVGCRCKSNCTTKSCNCLNNNRECDPDLCGDPQGLSCWDSLSGQSLSKCCKNMALQRGQRALTKVGVSTIPQAGWGLFATEEVARGELVGEYVGEIITDGEVERRGAIYDKGGGDGYLNCIFDLNRDYAVDATRMGNKIRFINHDALNPNCAPQVKMVNGEHRIGLYAIREIKPGDELFFNYGKSGEAVKFVAVERKGE